MKYVKGFFVGAYMVLIYALCLVLAVVSAGFTTVFYISGSEGTSQMLIGALAIVLESIKIILAFVFPFMAGRQGADSIRRILNVCLVLSIIASLNFFMSLGTSPAAGFVNGIYDLMGISFGKELLTFLLNMSLAVIIEVFVIHVPRFAHVFSAREVKEHNKSYLAKLLSIPRVILERKIDALVEKVGVENTVEVRERTENKPLAIELKHDREDKPVEIPAPAVVEAENDAAVEPVEEPQAEIEENNADAIVGNRKSTTLDQDSQRDLIHDIISHNAIENYRGLIKNPEDLLELFKNIMDADGVIQYKSKELEDALAVSSHQMRKWKKALEDSGKITTVGGNKKKVVA